MIIGSITTLPKRLLNFKSTLLSLLNQTFPLDVLYLNIPYETQKGEKYVIPEKVIKVLRKSKTKIMLQRCVDYGPITKIYPTILHLKELNYPENTTIITFDDDVLMSRKTVEMLMRGIGKYKNSAIGFNGWIVGSFPFMFENVHDEVRKCDWLEGKFSVAYPLKLVSNINIHTTPLHPKFNMHDDHIITRAVALAGGKFTVIPGRNKMIVRNDIAIIDSISGNAAKYLFEVSQIVKIMRSENIYNTKIDKTKSAGFKLIVAIILTMIMIFLINFLIFENRQKEKLNSSYNK